MNLHLPGRPPPSLLFKTPVALGECLVEPVVLVRNYVSSLGKNSCLNQTETGAMGVQPATFVMSFACQKQTAPGGAGAFSTLFFKQPGIHAKIHGKSEHNRAYCFKIQCVCMLLNTCRFCFLRRPIINPTSKPATKMRPTNTGALQDFKAQEQQ